MSGLNIHSGQAVPPAHSARHVPVLLDEVLEALAPRPGGRYLDGTLGLGGHSAAILARAGDNAELCGLDRDAEALGVAKEHLAAWGDKVHVFQRNYSDFAAALDELGWDEVDGALIDIGVSSLQIDAAERGFSFHADGPLDMRMDPDNQTSARQLISRIRVDELKRIIAAYGEDPQAGRIARAIVNARDRQPIETTGQLAAIVESAYPASWRAKARNHPATRTFQALRMVVNDEIGELERFLDNILSRLRIGGRVAVISFHSIEDRVVKHRMRQWIQGCVCPRHIPRCVCGHEPEARLLTTKPVYPGEAEIARNPRASSAKLRAAEKLSGAS